MHIMEGLLGKGIYVWIQNVRTRLRSAVLFSTTTIALLSLPTSSNNIFYLLCVLSRYGDVIFIGNCVKSRDKKIKFRVKMVVVPKTEFHMNKLNRVMELPSLSDCLLDAARPNVLFVTTVLLCKKSVGVHSFNLVWKCLWRILSVQYWL